LSVFFRKVEREDLELIKDWRNQERIRYNGRDHRLLSMEDQLRWFNKISNSESDDMYLVLEDSVPVGVCGFSRINWRDRSAEITYYLGRQKNAVVDVAIGIEAYGFLKRKGFEEYTLNRLYGEAFSFNEGGIKLAYHCGFKKEGIKRKSIFWKGKHWDGIIVSMVASEYRAEKGVNVVIIIQARMGSSRLPGKVLKSVLGKPLLEYLLERLKRVEKANAICIATTSKPHEQPILDICARMLIGCFRGSEDDVLERYYLAAQDMQADAIVRVTSDCPLIDPVEIDRLIEYYLNNLDKYDYVSHSLERTYPAGMESEIFSFEALKNAHENAKSISDREHVTPYLREHPHLFRLGNLTYKENHKHHRWTVDTPEDFELVAKIIEALYPMNREFSIEDILKLCEENSEWRNINAHVKQKAIR